MFCPKVVWEQIKTFAAACEKKNGGWPKGRGLGPINTRCPCAARFACLKGLRTQPLARLPVASNILVYSHKTLQQNMTFFNPYNFEVLLFLHNIDYKTNKFC